ncbi:MAG: alpha/beta fold hydrolase [bacterium]
MNRIKLAAFVVIALITGAAAHSAGPTAPAELLYSYDRYLPLHAEEKAVMETDDYTLAHITFRGDHERKVTALLAIPKKGAPPYPAVMLLHGINASKDGIFAEYGAGIAKAGYAVYAMDGEYHGEREIDVSKEIMRYPYTFGDMFVQTIRDLRRSADYLEGRGEIDAARMGYVGYSLGSFEGTVFAALEKRVKAVALVVGGSMKQTFGPLALSKEFRQMLPAMDPEVFVKKISPRPLLMVNAEDDILIPPGNAKILFDAAAEPKTHVFVKSGHVIPADILLEHLLPWLDENLKPSD